MKRRIEIEDCNDVIFDGADENLLTQEWLGQYGEGGAELQRNFYRLSISHKVPSNRDDRRALISALLDRQDTFDHSAIRDRNGEKHSRLILALITDHIVRLVDPTNQTRKLKNTP